MTPRTIFCLILAVAGTGFGVVLVCFDHHGCPRLWLAKQSGDPLLADFVEARNRDAQPNRLTQKVKRFLSSFLKLTVKGGLALGGYAWWKK